MLIQSWTPAIVYFFLIIICLVKLNKGGREYFALGFGFQLIASLNFRVASIFGLLPEYRTIFYQFNFALFLFFTISLFIGIYKLASQNHIQNTDLKFNELVFSFSGRINRKKFWIIWSITMLFSLIVGLMIKEISNRNGTGPLVFVIIILILYLIPSMWISLAIQVKRWHDRNKSGWMVLINFIPIIGQIWAIIELGFLKGTEGPNKYGNDPISFKN